MEQEKVKRNKNIKKLINKITRFLNKFRRWTWGLNICISGLTTIQQLQSWQWWKIFKINSNEKFYLEFIKPAAFVSSFRISKEANKNSTEFQVFNLKFVNHRTVFSSLHSPWGKFKTFNYSCNRVDIYFEFEISLKWHLIRSFKIVEWSSEVFFVVATKR